MTAPPLLDQALEVLLENLNHETFSFNEETSPSRRHSSLLPTKNTTWAFSIPCSSARQVQESTSTLLAAHALAKAGNVTLAWESLRALVMGQRDDGFLPKFRYLHDDDDGEYYLNHTTIPGPKLGAHLSALPLHASVVLDVYALSEQADEDLQHLVDLYVSIYRYHQYMIKHRPDHNVWHPWETLWDAHSWVEPLGEVRRQIRKSKWRVPFDVPEQVLQSYDYIPEVYEPCIYLLECYTNSTKNESTTTCPPLRIQSVEYAAIWVEAHRDLIEMYRVLKDRHLDHLLPLSEMDAEQPIEWLTGAHTQLDNMWDEEHQTFLPKKDENTAMIVPDASNFVSLWSPTSNVSRVYKLTSKLMQRDDSDFAFDCGAHAVWSQGGCSPTSTISPLLNYFIVTGLYRNDVHGMGYYISNATTNNLFPEKGFVDFAVAFDATTGMPFQDYEMDACALRSTTTAAVVYNLATPTLPRVFYPDPPIRSSAIIVLIIAEVVVAFAIGASCLFLNLKMVRESSRLVEDEQQGEDGYFSAAGSIGVEHPYELQNERNEDAEQSELLINPTSASP
eukprot:CAMPEP_0119025102 /NCGR_PEP_ID=MMETSP1176-20130426/33131_1 /TAXON_ID=265551 /ORGANISM="Synedropsis recta cf, Strain CCMP1620" /LENGTH=560 /DNA_ID=CAMNT_0006980561 /DNA_START=42 /DNA_END=1724 /DNA_ORIENTATION=+